MMVTRLMNIDHVYITLEATFLYLSLELLLAWLGI